MSTIQSDTNYLELVQTPQVKGSITRLPPTVDINIKSWVPRLHTLLCLAWLHISLLRFDSLLEHLTESWETLSVYWFIVKDIINVPNEQPDEEVHSMRSRRILITGASIPLELGCVTLLAQGFIY